jgi:sporulation protein YlmC with PRC-barrel domain
MQMIPALVPASKLKNYDVINPAGEDLGQVQNFMLDIANGRIAFAILSFGGTLGLTDKWFAVPWDAMQWSPETHKFVLNVPREAMKKMPGLGKKWEEELNLSVMNQICDAYGCRPYWMASPEDMELRGAQPKVIGRDTILT